MGANLKTKKHPGSFPIYAVVAEARLDPKNDHDRASVTDFLTNAGLFNTYGEAETASDDGDTIIELEVTAFHICEKPSRSRVAL